MEKNNQTEKTASEKLRELEENRKSFMAHVEEENKKFEARKQELIREERVQRMNEQLVWRDNLANRLMNEYNIKSLETMIFTDLEQKPIKSTPFEKVCMLSCFVLGILVSISTFIWGIL